MKRAFILFWHGLTGILTGIANWFTAILGMRDTSKYGRFLRRVVGTCFAIIMIVLAVAFINSLFLYLSKELQPLLSSDDSNTEYGESQFLSHTATYYYLYGGKGYVKDAHGNKTICDIDWIAKPLGDDSLVVFRKGDKRGYFNIFTGKEVIKPKYEHAWIFSDGLAAVDDEGKIKFIDSSGRVVIDRNTPYMMGRKDYVFHNGYCVMNDNSGKRVGLVDKTGKWALQPKYFRIECYDTLWVIDDGKRNAVLSASLKTIMPFTEAKYEVEGAFIVATMKDHTVRKYDFAGNMIDDFYIYSVGNMSYNTDELRCYTVTPDETSGYGETDEYRVQADAGCMKYQAELGWYGLMAKNGRIITMPLYNSITAIGKDLYFCKCNDYGIIINGKGERVKDK